jgi:uncharacterized RDD family membrane protein YckC
VSTALPHGASLPQPVPALRRRLACLIYEGTLLFGVVFIAALLYSVLTGQRHALIGRHGLGLVAFVLMPAIYFIGYWRKTGQTLPMQTWRIRLETADGRALSLARATARFIAAWVWVAPPLLLAALGGATSMRWLLPAMAGWIGLYAASSKLHRSGQFWHDLVCGTQLIDTRISRP